MPFLESPPLPDSDALLQRIRESPTLARYMRAFHQATGLSLWLAGPDTTHSCEAINLFCQTVTDLNGGCEACERSHSQLSGRGRQESVTLQCFARLRESAVPIWFGKSLIGHLRTGQVFSREPTEADFQFSLQVLREDPDLAGHDLDLLRPAYFSGKVLTEEHYQSIIDLLVIFSVQLCCELERLPGPAGGALPEPVQKVCQHLRARYDHKLSLEELASIAHLSPHHLCTVFKSATGMTLTEFQNRQRILQAKKKLASRYARVNEVALEVGFGSLSQFNRCFQKYAGQSPSEFRQLHFLHSSEGTEPHRGMLMPLDSRGIES